MDVYNLRSYRYLSSGQQDDFRRLGPRFGPQMKQLAKAIAMLDHETLVSLAGGGSVSVDLDGEMVELTGEDLVIERIPRSGLVVASEGQLVVALETELTTELIQEGLAREFVSKVQNMRKAADLEVTQRIRISFTGDSELEQAVVANADYVSSEVLAIECQSVTELSSGEELDINEHMCVVQITPERVGE